MEDKYKKIINKNPAESYLRSLKTKQAWDKFGFNFKAGMHKRKLKDKLTGNDDDKFGFKELTKIDFSSKKDVLYDNSYLRIIKHPIIKSGNSRYVQVFAEDKKLLGNSDVILDLFPNYVFIEDMHKENGIPKGFFENLINLLKQEYQNYYKGIVLLPLNKKLKDFYESFGFRPYIKTDIGDTYYKKDW